jgi:alpha-glucosidase
VCDRPDHIRGQAGADFLKVVPTVWEETRVLDAAVAHYVLVARRAADGSWFIAGLTDATAREVEVDLNFLGAGDWKLALWRDQAASDAAAEAVKFEERRVTRSGRLKLRLSPAGGFAGVPKTTATPR